MNQTASSTSATGYAINSVDKVWTVEDVMVEDVVTVATDTPYRRLVELLWTYGISGLPVVGAGGNLVGIVSESDLLRHEENPIGPRRSGRGGASLESALVAEDLMSAPVATISPDATLTEAARLMCERNLKRLPVLNKGGKVVGIISRADLLKVFLRSGETLSWDIDEVLRRSFIVHGNVKAESSEGVIRVTGSVESEDQAARIEASLKKLAGVVAVDNGLTWPGAVPLEAPGRMQGISTGQLRDR